MLTLWKKICEIEKAKKISIVAKKTIKQKIDVVVVVVIETIKFEIYVKNINYFDFIMQIDFWEKFCISINNANFLRRLIDAFVKYKKNNILKILYQCFRDFVFKCVKTQFEFILLNDFKTIMTLTFSFAFVIDINFDRIIIEFSSSIRYHICSQCVVQFSSISRFLIHVQKIDCIKIFTYKHCDEIFTSNKKFHMHVCLHHNNLFDKTLKHRFKEKKIIMLICSLHVFLLQLYLIFLTCFLFHRLYLN